MEDAYVQIRLIENTSISAGNTWITRIAIDECSPRGIKKAAEEALGEFLKNLARDTLL